MRGGTALTLLARGSAGARRWSSASGDMYAQKLQHHLLDGEFKAALDMYKLTTKETPRSLQNVMALIERLAVKKDATRVQRSTIAFFLKQQRALAGPLLAAYHDLEVAPPPPAFRELLLFLVQAGDLPRIIQALHMALDHRIPVAADALHQCFLLDRDDDDDDDVEVTRDHAFDPLVMTSLFSQSCKAGLVTPLSYPGLGDAILSSCFRRGILDEAVASMALLPPGSAHDMVHQHLLAIIQSSPRMSSAKFTATRQALYESLVAFHTHFDRTYAWYIFQAMEKHDLVMPPLLLKDLALAILKQGARKDAVDAVLEYATRHRVHVHDAVFAAGLDQPHASLDWARRYCDAIQGGIAAPPSTVLVVDASIKALLHGNYDLARELNVILLQEAEGPPDQPAHARLLLTMQTLDQLKDDEGSEKPTSEELVVNVLLRKQVDQGMELFYRLVSPTLERASMIQAPMLETLLDVARSAADAAVLLQHARTHGISLSASAVASSLSKFSRLHDQALLPYLRNVVDADGVVSAEALQLLRDAASALDQVIPEATRADVGNLPAANADDSSLS